MTREAVVVLEQLSKSYSLNGLCHSVLNQINLKLYAGEMLALVGSSGSGKSTLMNIIGLLDKADSGQYLLEQRRVTELSDEEASRLRNRCMGFVFQQFHLLARLTARQNVALPLIYRSLSKAEINERAMLALQRVGMERFANHRPSQLSGGQQQRVAIARALVGEPRIILADEPTGALDSRTGSEVMSLFKKLHQEGSTLMLVTHDANIAAQCQRQITLVDGQVEST